MTPREHLTLEIILRHIANFNGREVKGARFEHLRILRRGEPTAGDVVIERVEFKPPGAKCA